VRGVLKDCAALLGVAVAGERREVREENVRDERDWGRRAEAR